MTATTRLMARLAGLGPALTHHVLVERGVRVPAPDGVELVTDVHLPRLPGPLPTILVRTPYGRDRFWSAQAGAIAERGYNVVVQSCRGTFGSGGSIDFKAEAGDGRATADWIVEQSWSNGEIGGFGPRYLSFAQWALASTRPPQLKAMAIQIMASDRRRSYYPGGSFALDNALSWTYMVAHQEELNGFARFRASAEERRALDVAFAHLPLIDADVAAMGFEVPRFRDWLRHDEPGDEWWEPIRFGRVIPTLGIPVSMVGGWYDYYLPYMLEDHAALVAAGARVRLTIGAWAHASARGMLAGLRQAIEWFDVHLRGQEAPPPPPVRVAVMGGGGWRNLAAWPPPSTPTAWHLQPGGALSTGAPPASAPDRYRYDPADPTPAVGGTSLSENSGPRDNRALEARPDVLTYTAPPLERDLEIAGPVAADVYLASSLAHTDVFVRLCDVAPRGRSVNVCDGLLRLRPGAPPRDAEGVARVRVELWPTAHRFRRGHRIRVQVSSGAHPRFARNPGSGEPLATATTLVAADQAVYHDPAHPSAVTLPVLVPPPDSRRRRPGSGRVADSPAPRTKGAAPKGRDRIVLPVLRAHGRRNG